VTRDRNYAEAEWAGRRYLLVETGGLDSETGNDLGERVQEQSRRAVEEADVVLFLFDGKDGLNPLDREVVDTLRKVGKAVFFAVNKLDSRRRGDNLYEFLSASIRSTRFPPSMGWESPTSWTTWSSAFPRCSMRMRRSSRTKASHCASPSSAVPMSANRP
jgi:hypothetical protein